VGGFDGVSLLAFEYLKLLNKLGLKVNIITGDKEEEYGYRDYHGNKVFLINRLSFKHPNSQYLFNNCFVRSNENMDTWMVAFNKHKEEIKKSLEKKILKKEDAPIIVHNMLSLRYLHPAAAIAVKELIEKYSNRYFVNFAPDSDWERVERLEHVKDEVKETISCGSGLKNGTGPYNYKNLFHIVLNPVQRKVFHETYKVPKDHIFEIPDFLEFKSQKLNILDSPKQGFLDHLSKNCMLFDNGKIKSRKKELGPDMVYFLCPVRPVKRKKIRTSIFLAHQFSLKAKKNVSVILTHPNVDEKEFWNYFVDCIKFANALDVNLIFLGDSLKLVKEKEGQWTLDDIYRNMAALNTIGMITSYKGGWENAINELLYAGIPVFMNPKLNSYKPITEKMKLKVLAKSLDPCDKIIQKHKVEELKDLDATDVPEINDFVSWVEDYYDSKSEKRTELINYNYDQAYKNISLESKKDDVKKLLEKLQ